MFKLQYYINLSKLRVTLQEVSKHQTVTHIKYVIDKTWRYAATEHNTEIIIDKCGRVMNIEHLLYTVIIRTTDSDVKYLS